MKIEVLYVPGCPNRKPAVEAVMDVLDSESCEADVLQIPVQSESDARALHFPGSPTIRVNGGDIEPESISGFGLACRLYGNGLGVPSEAAIRTAVAAARKQE
jgi:hypothetical protein